MAAAIIGTFTGTGNSSEIAVAHAVIDLTFVGTATVNLHILSVVAFRQIIPSSSPRSNF